MTNIIDYLSWRGDLTFSQTQPCAVDMLIFAQLVHAPLERLNGGGMGLTIAQLESTVYPTPPDKDENVLVRSRYELWRTAARSVRFGGVTLERFVARFDPENEKQFAAALFKADEGVGVASFRGTDATLVGWKEDFNLAFESPIPSQIEAVGFLRDAAALFPVLLVTGHSKGGNLSLYASAMCGQDVQPKLRRVYSFDGPGLDNATLQDDGYRAIAPRISAYVPESSIIGLLLGYHDAFTIIQSDSVSLWQHNPYYWHVLGPDFEVAEETTRSSQFTDQTLHDFLNDCTPEDRRVLVDTLYNILSVSGARALKELPRGIATHFSDILAALKDVPPESKQVLMRVFKSLAGAGAEHLRILLGDEEAKADLPSVAPDDSARHE